MLKLNYKHIKNLLEIALSEELLEELLQLEGSELLKTFHTDASVLAEFISDYSHFEFIPYDDLENKIFKSNLYKSIKTYLNLNVLNKQNADDELVEEIIEGLNNVTLVHKFGGEGEGDTMLKIVKFESYNVYLQISGYSDSYNGTDWDDISEVFPFVQISTEYSGYKSNWTIEQLTEKLEETFNSINI